MRAILVTLAAVGLMAGCDEVAPSGRGDAMPGPAEGQALFTEYCVLCHGADGKGDGRLARAMRRPPADLTLLSVRHGDSFPTAKVLSTIDGYAKADYDNPVMPEFGELLAGDTIPYDTGDGTLTPTPRQLVALVEYLKTIQETR